MLQRQFVHLPVYSLVKSLFLPSATLSEVPHKDLGKVEELQEEMQDM